MIHLFVLAKRNFIRSTEQYHRLVAVLVIRLHHAHRLFRTMIFVNNWLSQRRNQHEVCRVPYAVLWQCHRFISRISIHIWLLYRLMQQWRFVRSFVFLIDKRDEQIFVVFRHQILILRLKCIRMSHPIQQIAYICYQRVFKGHVVIVLMNIGHEWTVLHQHQ